MRATTGEVVWERAVAYYRHGYYITLAPLVVDGKVIVGTSGGRVRHPRLRRGARCDDRPRDLETVHDSRPGRAGEHDLAGRRVAHRRRTGLADGHLRPGARPHLLGRRQRRPVDGRTRAPATTSTRTRRSHSTPTPASCAATTSTTGTDPGTGTRPARPLLVDVERNGRTLPALVHAGRNGYLWLLDRSGGDMRFVEAERYVHQDVFTGLDPVSGRPEYDPSRVPRIGERVEFCPAMRGARNWRPEAYSPDTGMLYVPATPKQPLLGHGGAAGGVPRRSRLRWRGHRNVQPGGHRPRRRAAGLEARHGAAGLDPRVPDQRRFRTDHRRRSGLRRQRRDAPRLRRAVRRGALELRDRAAPAVERRGVLRGSRRAIRRPCSSRRDRNSPTPATSSWRSRSTAQC